MFGLIDAQEAPIRQFCIINHVVQGGHQHEKDKFNLVTPAFNG